MKTLLYDIETAPNLGYYFELYKEGNILFNKTNWYILSFAYKWLESDKTYVFSLPDFKTYKKDRENDKELVKELWKLFDEADLVIAHNGNQFDQKKSNARFIFHHLKPPSPYKEIDTKLVAKRYFRFDSNKLDALGKYLGIGEKLQTGGFELWKRCIAGDPKAWDVMCCYNKQDVVLLEKVYLALRPWIQKHPTDRPNCANCGGQLHSRGLQLNGDGSKYPRYQCKECGAWSKGKKLKSIK